MSDLVQNPQDSHNHLFRSRMDHDHNAVRMIEDEILPEHNVIPEDLQTHPAVLALQDSQAAFLVTDPRLPGNPIVYANPDFLELTKYPVDRVIGRNCRFMQGPDTDPICVSRVRKAVEAGEDVSIILLNYRYDGSTFWNHLLVSPIKDADGQVIYFLGCQYEVSPHQAALQQVLTTANDR